MDFTRSLSFCDLPDKSDETDPVLWRFEKDDGTLDELNFDTNIDDWQDHDKNKAFEVSAQNRDSNEILSANGCASIIMYSSRSARRLWPPLDEFDDDALVSSIVAQPMESTFPPAGNLGQRSMEIRSDTSEQTCIGNSRYCTESMHRQYQHIMKRLLASMERTDQTRDFFKRRRLDLGEILPWSSDCDMSRKKLFRLLRRDSGSYDELTI